MPLNRLDSQNIGNITYETILFRVDIFTVFDLIMMLFLLEARIPSPVLTKASDIINRLSVFPKNKGETQLIPHSILIDMLPPFLHHIVAFLAAVIAVYD